MFYEDQHKLAAYLERNPDAEWEWEDAAGAAWHKGGTQDAFSMPSEAIEAGHPIRPVLRYGLPSHLQSEIHNPDNLTEEQICEGGKYRACVVGDTGKDGFQWWDGKKWQTRSNHIETLIGRGCASTFRLPATVPWPDWEREEAAQPDPKDARIAELEMQLLALSNSCESLWETCRRIISPWRPMSEVPTEDECDPIGRVLAVFPNSEYLSFIQREDLKKIHLLAWMPVPKFHGWPDPLADLLKAHGVDVTLELTAALNAWKGVEK